MRFFCHFLEFGSEVFLEIAYDDSLRQCLTSSRVVELEQTKKKFGPKLGPNRPKLGPKLGFLPFSQVWFISFHLNSLG